MPEILIGIITFRRPDQLKRLLLALAGQEFVNFTFSILVVDNDSQGSARQVCADIAGGSVARVIYRQEQRPGIVAARNRCVADFLASSADFLAFIDDDEWPSSKTWLSSMLACIQEYGADVVAGDVLSSPGPGTPVWATQILYEKSKKIDGSPMTSFYTGNVLISRAVLEQLTPAFDDRFAHTGASDYHFALRCIGAGFKAVFVDAIVIEEFPVERATTGWFMKRGFRSGAGYTKSHIIEEPLYLIVPRCFALSFIRAARGTLLVVRGCVVFDKAAVVKGLFRISSALGTLAGLGGITYAEYRNLHQ